MLIIPLMKDKTATNAKITNNVMVKENAQELDGAMESQDHQKMLDIITMKP